MELHKFSTFPYINETTFWTFYHLPNSWLTIAMRSSYESSSTEEMKSFTFCWTFLVF